MGRPKGPEPSKLKSWSEANKIRKEEKRKWKEINLAKKLDKQKPKQEPTTETPPTQNEHSTISIAVPGSILENSQSPELRSYLAGQIARAACIFKIDEIVIFDDYCEAPDAKTSNFEGQKLRDCCVQLGRILQYLECPQYLRKQFFPIHKHLKFCGILNPLNAPHHLTRDEKFLFREGVVLDKPVKPGRGSLVNVGLYKDCQVDKLLTPGLRCTVKLSLDQETSKKLKGVIVAPTAPRNELGVYWGYSIRLASSLSKIFSQSPYPDGYDLTVGTSDKGDSIDDFQAPVFKHALIVFGGVEGLEFALENDQVLEDDDPRLLFDFYLNTLPDQGSKTIRTEEAILVTLAALRPKFTKK